MRVFSHLHDDSSDSDHDDDGAADAPENTKLTELLDSEKAPVRAELVRAALCCACWSLFFSKAQVLVFLTKPLWWP